MQPTTQIAKNHIRISHSLFHEGIRATASKSYKKAVQKIALILAALYLIIAAYLLYTSSSLILLLGESVFLAALLFWLTVMLPGTRRRSKYKAMAQGSGSPQREQPYFSMIISLLQQTAEKKLLFHMTKYWIGRKRDIYISLTAKITSVFCLIKTDL